MFLGQTRPVHPVTDPQLLRSIDPTDRRRPQRERKYRDASKLAARAMSDERARSEQENEEASLSDGRQRIFFADLLSG